MVSFQETIYLLWWGVFCFTSGLKKTAGQHTMSGLIEALIGQTFDLLVILMVKIECNNNLNVQTICVIHLFTKDMLNCWFPDSRNVSSNELQLLFTFNNETWKIQQALPNGYASDACARKINKRFGTTYVLRMSSITYMSWKVLNLALESYCHG